MSGERKGVLYVFIAAVLYSLGGLCIKLIPDWSGLALNAGRNGIALAVYGIFFAAARHKPRFNRWIFLGACCVCATLSAPDATPSVACQVQAALGLPEDRPALDINAACSGFLYGMAVARGLLETLGGQYALVIGCEALSRLMDPADRSTCVLFGDGAGAAIFRLADTPFALTLGARGSDVLHAGGPDRNGSAPITMDGRAVFRFAVETLPKCLHAVLDETQLTLGDLSWVVCHQANSRIIDHCVKALNADPAKFYKNMDRHGNTSAASIPVALNELAESGQLTPGRPLACIGFGGGLTWGGMIVEYKG